MPLQASRRAGFHVRGCVRALFSPYSAKWEVRATPQECRFGIPQLPTSPASSKAFPRYQRKRAMLADPRSALLSCSTLTPSRYSCKACSRRSSPFINSAFPSHMCRRPSCNGRLSWFDDAGSGVSRGFSMVLRGAAFEVGTRRLASSQNYSYGGKHSCTVMLSD